MAAISCSVVIVDLSAHQAACCLWEQGHPGGHRFGPWMEIGRHLGETVHALGTLYGAWIERRTKICQAPKRWGKPGELCGAQFIGRPNQIYCSPTCGTRLATRKLRAS